MGMVMVRIDKQQRQWMPRLGFDSRSAGVCQMNGSWNALARERYNPIATSRPLNAAQECLSKPAGC